MVQQRFAPRWQAHFRFWHLWVRLRPLFSQKF